jgi:hypothetical protein
MHEVMAAGLRATRDLGRGEILWQALWPPLVAFGVWTGVAYVTWLPLAAWLLDKLPEWSWLAWLGPYLVHVVLALCFAPLIYATALLLVALVALPRMMAIVARNDYPDVTRQASAASAFWGSLSNTVGAGTVFIVGWLLTLPLLLIPGALLVLPLFWSAWLNQRTFRFDVLAEHATAAERATLIKRERPRFWLAGLAAALVAHVPLVNIFAPGFGGLVFLHIGLEAIRRIRRQEGITV